MTKNIKKKISDLRKEIIKHNELYYLNGAPEISDSKYDGLMKELKALEKENPELVTLDSPTQTVGAPIPDKFEKVKHTAPMLSLESINDEKGAEHFDETCVKETVEPVEYMCEPKLDGISIELVYEKGKFLSGSTRGDGKIGENVTLNLKTIPNIPAKLKIDNPPERLAVRGEVMMHISDFQALNKRQVAEGKDTFANPRNVVAGSMRQLDYRVTKKRKLHVYCYRILDITEEAPATQKESIEYMKKAGLLTAPNVKFCKNITDAISYHHEMEAKRETLDHEIDGIVIKVNDIDLQNKLGMRTSNPKWAVAYKFEPRKEITKVDDIAIQVGRTGVLTPLALLQPVEVGGVTVSRATLHNMDQVRRLGIKIGDHVKVQRAGDVIPYITEVIKEKRTGKEKEFHMPKECPSCRTPVEWEDVFCRCPAGLVCPAQVKELISHYASKGAVDIDGFSDKTGECLYDAGLIKGIADIYTLKREDILKLEGWKEKKTDNLLGAIEKAKNVTLDRFIVGLGIRNVGKHLAAVISDTFGTLDKIIDATKEDLIEINEVGPEIAESITHFFSEKKNIDEIEKMKKNGVIIKQREIKSGGKFAGKKIVFTGSLQKMTRSDAQKIVESEGGMTSSSVGFGIDIVVTGLKAGSKLDKAKKIGITILTEEEFIKLSK